MSADINLFDLVNISIGTPEVGAVNFNALHTLLHSILEHLKIQNLTVEWREWGVGQKGPKTGLSGERPSPYHCMADKLLYIEKKIAALERLPNGKELLSRTSSGTATSVNDMWQMMQLRRKVETNEEGVSKCMALMQDLLQEIQELKENRDNLKKEIRALQNQLDKMNVDQLEYRVTVMEQGCYQVDNLENCMQELQKKVALYPHPEEFSQCLTWEVMQATLVNDKLKKKDKQDSIPCTGHPFAPSEVDTPLIPGFSPIRDLPGSSDPNLGGTHGVPQPHLPMLSISSGAEHYPETVQALRNIGRLLERHERLEDRVEHLERGKTDQAQVQQLREMLHDMGKKSTPENILDQVSKSECSMDAVSVSESPDIGEIVTHSESSSSQDNSSIIIDRDQLQQQYLQIANLSKDVQKLEEEVEKLKKELTCVRIEQKTSPDKHMQDQLNNLHSMLEDMMTSSSAMLSWSLQQERPDVNQGRQDETLSQGQHWGQAAGQRSPRGPSGQAGPTSPSSMVDLSRKVSQLFQRYEKLHGMVTGFVKQQESDRTKHGFDISSELISHMQDAILQLQSECEKLHSTTSQLMEAHIQKQSHIDYLYQTMGELEEKKADRELVEVEIGVKADKKALETKVSRIQYDAMTEQLNTMFQELLNKVTGQEQDWHKVIEKISTEMECKLNRIELDPLKKQLEDRWKSIHKQLQAQPAPEHDDAAGLRKQLVARFHCISCDRPVHILTPGSPFVTVPSASRLPSHRSNRPYTVYELERVRQNSRRPGTNKAHYEKACSERSLAQMRCIHSMMCRQIDRVQRKLDSPGTPKLPHSQGLRDFAQLAHLPILGSLQKHGRSSTPKHERITEMADFRYTAISRSCGGRHTLSSTSQRYSRMRCITHLIHTEEDRLLMSGSSLQLQSDEVNILGVDGHIYKGHLNNRAVKTMENRLPPISPKEGKAAEQIQSDTEEPEQ